MPYKTTGIAQVREYIRGEWAREATERLRTIGDKREAQRFKAQHFMYATFSGVFTKRCNKCLVEHSGLLCLDFDDVPHVEELRRALAADSKYEAQLLFKSPSGKGLKWVVEIDLEQAPHSEWFAALRYYAQVNYDVLADASGKDVSRACYLGWDPKISLL